MLILISLIPVLISGHQPHPRIGSQSPQDSSSHYIEDFDYLGDRGFTVGIHFDLNEQNVRWRVTPEFPSGTYLVEASTDLTIRPDVAPAVIASSDSATFVETDAKNIHDNRFYRVSRKSLAAFDANGFDYTPPGSVTASAPGGSAARGTTVTVTITLPITPPNPGISVMPTSITLAGSILGTAISRPSATTARATFTIPANAPTGLQAIVVVFPGPTYNMAGAFTIN